MIQVNKKKGNSNTDYNTNIGELMTTNTTTKQQPEIKILSSRVSGTLTPMFSGPCVERM